MERVEWRALGVHHYKTKIGEYLYHITNDTDVIDLVFEEDLQKYGLKISDFEMYKSYEGDEMKKGDSCPFCNQVVSGSGLVCVTCVKKMKNESSKVTEGAVTEKKQSSVEYCAELIASGLSKEEVLKAIAKKYTDAGKDEAFAMKRAKSIYATTVKTVGGK